MNAPRLRSAAIWLLLLSSAACAQEATSRQTCPLVSLGAVKDTSVLKVTPRRGMMGEHLQVWVQTPAPVADLKKLQLFLDGHPIPGLAATQVGARCAVHHDKKQDSVIGYREIYEYVPRRTDASRDAWAHLLGSPNSFIDMVRVGAGLPAGPEFKAAADSTVVAFTVVDETRFWIAFVAFAALLALLVWAGATTGLLRDDTEKPAAAAETRPFSLGKVVMAMWTFLILAGFFGLWLITGDHRGILTAQSFVLMGVTGFSAAVSIAMTQNKNRGAKDPPVLCGFFTDLIFVGDQPSLHRLQNLVWNVAFALVFVSGTYRMLAFPEFDSNLMLLLGISQTLYLGLKITEPRKSSERRDPTRP